MERNTTMSPRFGCLYGISGPIQDVRGENNTRFTNTWSPISRVLTIDDDGISNACRTKVMIKSPVTSTPASDARNSTVVSRGFSCFCVSLSLSFFANSSSSVRHASNLLHQPQGTVPARDLRNVSHCIQEPVKFITGGCVAHLRVRCPHRPVNQQRPSHNILLRYETPVPAVITVVPVVAHHKVVALRHNELTVLDQLLHLQPPRASE